MHLDVHIGAGGAGAQLVDIGQPGVLGQQRDDLAPRLVGEFVVHQLARGFPEDADRAPEQHRGDGQRRQAVDAVQPEPGGDSDAHQGDHVGGQIGGVVRPVAGHRHGGGLFQHLALGDEQEGGQHDGDDHHGDRPALLFQRVRGQDVAHRLAGDQGGGGEHQASLHQAGERLGLAVSITVLSVGRRGGVAHGEESDQRRHQVEAGIRCRGEQGHRARGQPGGDLEGHQDGGGSHRQQRHAACQPGGLGGGQGVRRGHRRTLAFPAASWGGNAELRRRFAAVAPRSATGGGSTGRRPAVHGHGRSSRPPVRWRRRR